MDTSRYTSLYALQDEVLAVIFEESVGFYLTGGTALSRFYLNHRYSDDLDFFNHDIAVFPDAFRFIHSKLELTWPDISIEVDARDFKRLRIGRGESELKLDFVADRVQLGRDEGRDIADILYISKSRKFSWDVILNEAQLKEGFQLEDLLFRLDTFPIKMLETVPFVAVESIDAFAEQLARIRSDMWERSENSLAGSTALDV
jgi:hypothetical protein